MKSCQSEEEEVAYHDSESHLRPYMPYQQRIRNNRSLFVRIEKMRSKIMTVDKRISAYLSREAFAHTRYRSPVCKRYICKIGAYPLSNEMKYEVFRAGTYVRIYLPNFSMLREMLGYILSRIYNSSPRCYLFFALLICRIYASIRLLTRSCILLFLIYVYLYGISSFLFPQYSVRTA